MKPPQPPGESAGGPAAAEALYSRTRRSPRGRLSRSGDFDRVFRNGRSHASRELVLYVFPRAQDGPPRLGLSVSRKVGGAVERNRIKRLLREAFSIECAKLPPGTDVVLVARPDASPLAEREGAAGIQRVLGDLIERSTVSAAATGDGGSGRG